MIAVRVVQYIGVYVCVEGTRHSWGRCKTLHKMLQDIHYVVVRCYANSTSIGCNFEICTGFPIGWSDYNSRGVFSILLPTSTSVNCRMLNVMHKISSPCVRSPRLKTWCSGRSRPATEVVVVVVVVDGNTMNFLTKTIIVGPSSCVFSLQEVLRCLSFLILFSEIIIGGASSYRSTTARRTSREGACASACTKIIFLSSLLPWKHRQVVQRHTRSPAAKWGTS